MNRAEGRELNTAGNSTRKEEGAKVLPLPRKNISRIGLVIFLFIFLYLAYSLVSFATKDKVYSFTVGLPEQMGVSSFRQAILLRKEEPVRSDYAGYVDFFLEEGSRAAVGNPVVAVDEIGSFSDSIRSSLSVQNLNDSQLLDIKERLKSFSADYDGMRFHEVYEAERGLGGNYFAGISSRYLKDLLAGSSSEFFHVRYAARSGLVCCYQDGYESCTAAQLKASDFRTSDYRRVNTAEVVAKDDFLYKTVYSENWSLVFPVTAEEASVYEGKTKLSFTFLKNGLETSAACSLITGADGSYLVKLDLTQYMIQFISERFTGISIHTAEEKGYKIPRSCLTSANCYLIPNEYETDSGFLVMDYSGGSGIPVATKPDVVFRDGSYCYVLREELPEGCVLAKPDSQERYTVRLTQSLDGVLVINKGFTEFTPVELLDESADYLLVSKATVNGISAYDTLLLNAKGHADGEILP